MNKKLIAVKLILLTMMMIIFLFFTLTRIANILFDYDIYYYKEEVKYSERDKCTEKEKKLRTDIYLKCVLHDEPICYEGGDDLDGITCSLRSCDDLRKELVPCKKERFELEVFDKCGLYSRICEIQKMTYKKILSVSNNEGYIYASDCK